VSHEELQSFPKTLKASDSQAGNSSLEAKAQSLKREDEPFRNVVNISVPTFETIKAVLYDELERNPFRSIRYTQIDTRCVTKKLRIVGSALGHTARKGSDNRKPVF